MANQNLDVCALTLGRAACIDRPVQNAKEGTRWHRFSVDVHIKDNNVVDGA